MTLGATVRLAAVGDLHCSHGSLDSMTEFFELASEQADVLLLCGDLTDYGLPEEAAVLARAMKHARDLTVLGVLGNHDHESARVSELSAILREGGLVLLDGDTHVEGDVGFAGVKGFAGGFGGRMLQPWGEAPIKSFVRESVDEATKLEGALASLCTQQRVVLLHYAPVVGTVEGEPYEIFPFLGSSRFEDCIDRYGATVVFHGHAHRGSAFAETRTGIPVYNVALPLLKACGEGEPFRILDLPRPSSTE